MSWTKKDGALTIAGTDLLLAAVGTGFDIDDRQGHRSHTGYKEDLEQKKENTK